MKRQEEISNRKVVIIEADRKGCYERFALSEDEFDKNYGEFLRKDMPQPSEDGETYTFCPMEHVWYALTDIGSDLWKIFFSDMAWGLPEGDVGAENFASISFADVESLRKEVERSVFH